MMLKRHYDPATKEIAHLELIHSGAGPERHFSTRFVADALARGWMTIVGNRLAFHVKPETLHYTIVRVPGKYLCATEPSGYEIIHYYDCVLDAEQHRRWSQASITAAKEHLHG